MEKNIKYIFPVLGIFPVKFASITLLGFECTINPQNLIKIVRAIFYKIIFLNFFLMWTTLNFRFRVKTKNKIRDICERTLDIDFERDWWVGLGPALGDEKKLKFIFPVSGIFSGKADSVILLCFECTINTHNLIKIVVAIFEKIKIFYFFLVNYP